MGISVVIPFFNSSATIEASIYSAINQTYPPDEIIVINDGSSKDESDKLLSIISKIDFKDIKFKYFVQKNAGPSAARNKGVEMSNMEWIAFLDSDDAWDYRKLAIQTEAIRVNEKGVLFGVKMGIKDELNNDKEFHEVSFLSNCISNKFSTPGVIVKKDVFLKFKFDINKKFSEDYKLWLEISANYKVYKNNSILCYSLLGKNKFGDSGLSSNLVEMEKGELSNYIYLYKKKYLKIYNLFFLYSWSFIKFLRRYFICKVLR